MGSVHTPQPIKVKAVESDNKISTTAGLRKHALLAYLKVMLHSGAPHLGTAEHRAILLFRDMYPGARPNKVNSRLRVTQLAVIRRFQKEYGKKVLPYKVWIAINRGIEKMSEAFADYTIYLQSVNNEPVDDATLLLAVQRLLVLPETHSSPLRPRSTS